MKTTIQKVKERNRINSLIRSFFVLKGSLEVETPILVRSPGMEPNLDPFETTIIEPDGTTHAVGLITSPEYSMKKLLGAGLEKIFTITKVFRNREELGGTHYPEFSLLEWYVQGEDYQACMDETEELVRMCAKEFGREIGEIPRVRVKDLFTKYVGIDLDTADANILKKTCEKLGIRTHETDTESDLFYRLFLEKIEKNLGTLFVFDYPKHQAALSRLSKDGIYGERFELYLDGMEMCNGFTELTNAEEQRHRFKKEAQERRGLRKKVFPIDERLLESLSKIRSPTFGNALGIDRLHMWLVGEKDIGAVSLIDENDF